MNATQKKRSHIGSTTAKERAKEFPADFYDDSGVTNVTVCLIKARPCLWDFIYNTSNGPNGPDSEAGDGLAYSDDTSS